MSPVGGREPTLPVGGRDGGCESLREPVGLAGLALWVPLRGPSKYCIRSGISFISSLHAAYGDTGDCEAVWRCQGGEEPPVVHAIGPGQAVLEENRAVLAEDLIK